MNHDELKKLLIAKLNKTRLGNVRIYKFVIAHLENESEAKEFMLKQGYTLALVNKIIYDIDYRKARYLNQVNTATDNREGHFI